MEPIAVHMSLIGLTILGFIISFYIAMKKHTGARLVCPMKSDCNAVIHSHHSRFLGFRVEYLGMFYYGLLAFYHGLFIVFPAIGTPFLLFIGIVVSAQAFLFSCYLVAIQAFVLKEWCTWCLTSAFLCLLIFIITLVHVPMPLPELFGHFTRVVTIVHLFGTTIGVGAATITDIFFFRFLRDYRISEEESSILKLLSNVIWVALGILIMTGIILFIPKSAVLLVSGKFLTKMTAIAVLIVNGFLLNIIIQPRLVQITFGGDHAHKEGELHHLRKLAFALGGISITSWYFIFVLGTLRGVTVAYTPLVLAYGGLLLFAVIGSQIFDHYFIQKAPGVVSEE